MSVIPIPIIIPTEKTHIPIKKSELIENLRQEEFSDEQILKIVSSLDKMGPNKLAEKKKILLMALGLLFGLVAGLLFFFVATR